MDYFSLVKYEKMALQKVDYDCPFFWGKISKYMKKVFISTIGCAIAHNDNQLYIDYFRKNNWKICTRPNQANLIMLNLCALNNKRETFNLDYVKNIKRKNPHADIFVVGCIAVISKEKLEKSYSNYCTPITNTNDLDNIIKAKTSLKDISSKGILEFNPILNQLKAVLLNNPINYFFKNAKKTLYFFTFMNNLYFPLEHKINKKTFVITISTGCMDACSYCAIKFARSELKSIPSNDVIAKVQSALMNGYNKIHLLGTNPSQYGKDIENETSYAELINRVIRINKDFSLILPDFAPDYFVENYDQLEKSLKDKRVKEITFSLQSGSNKIIKSMNRYYDISRFSKLYERLKSLNPKIKLNCHIIIGFPGETKEDFMETINIVKRLRFNKILIFEYSDRPGTKSSNLPGHLDKKEIIRRLEYLNKIQFIITFKRIIKSIFGKS